MWQSAKPDHETRQIYVNESSDYLYEKKNLGLSNN